MAVIQASDVGDLIRNSINRLNRGKYTPIATDRQKYIVTRRLMRKSKVVFDSGPLFQWNLMIDHSNSAEAVGLYHVDTVNQTDVMAQAVVPWRRYHAAYPIEHQVVQMNTGEARIVSIVETAKKSCEISLMEMFEDRFWRLPPTTDNLHMYGVPYWIVKNNTEGFNGGHPGSYTDVAGLSRTTYPRWRNYTAQYTAVTKDDLVQKWARAAEFTDWEPPVDGLATFDTGQGYGFYTNWNVLGTLRRLLEQQNDSLGTDLDSMHGKVVFQRTPVDRVPALEADTTNPVYGIPWGVFKIATLSGWWMKETVVDMAAKQHTVSEYHKDCSFQPHMYDCRKAFVLATNTGLPS